MRNLKIAVGIVVALAALYGIYYFQPPRLTEARLEAALNHPAADAEEGTPPQQDAAADAEEEITVEQDDATTEPENEDKTFKVKFETTAGEFIVEVHREWAPIGAQRFKELVKAGYYDENRFFRVVPGFVVQFGLSGDPEVTAEWRQKRLKDDPVRQTNSPGTITFATSGPDTRTTQLFINFGNNARLDSMGFAPFGKVVEGFDVVQKINPEYREQPDQGRITAIGNAYLDEAFPRLDHIKTARIIDDED